MLYIHTERQASLSVNAWNGSGIHLSFDASFDADAWCERTDEFLDRSDNADAQFEYSFS